MTAAPIGGLRVVVQSAVHANDLSNQIESARKALVHNASIFAALKCTFPLTFSASDDTKIIQLLHRVTPDKDLWSVFSEDFDALYNEAHNPTGESFDALYSLYFNTLKKFRFYISYVVLKTAYKLLRINIESNSKKWIKGLDQKCQSMNREKVAGLVSGGIDLLHDYLNNYLDAYHQFIREKPTLDFQDYMAEKLKMFGGKKQSDIISNFSNFLMSYFPKLEICKDYREDPNLLIKFVGYFVKFTFELALNFIMRLVFKHYALNKLVYGAFEKTATFSSNDAFIHSICSSLSEQIEKYLESSQTDKKRTKPPMPIHLSNTVQSKLEQVGRKIVRLVQLDGAGEENTGSLKKAIMDETIPEVIASNILDGLKIIDDQMIHEVLLQFVSSVNNFFAEPKTINADRELNRLYKNIDKAVSAAIENQISSLHITQKRQRVIDLNASELREEVSYLKKTVLNSLKLCIQTTKRLDSSTLHAQNIKDHLETIKNELHSLHTHLQFDASRYTPHQIQTLNKYFGRTSRSIPRIIDQLDQALLDVKGVLKLNDLITAIEKGENRFNIRALYTQLSKLQPELAGEIHDKLSIQYSTLLITRQEDLKRFYLESLGSINKTLSRLERITGQVTIDKALKHFYQITKSGWHQVSAGIEKAARLGNGLGGKVISSSTGAGLFYLLGYSMPVVGIAGYFAQKYLSRPIKTATDLTNRQILPFRANAIAHAQSPAHLITFMLSVMQHVPKIVANQR